MSIRAKRAILFAALAIGCIWNSLCLISFLHIKQYVYSLIFVGGICFIMNFKYLFLSFTKNEKSAYIKTLTPSEKIWAGIAALLATVWIGTAIACMIY